MESKDNKHSVVVSKIIKYLNEYDKVVKSSTFMEKGIKKDMIVLRCGLFLFYIEKTKILEVSFMAGANPEMVGNCVLRLQKTPGVGEIKIFESYFYNDKDKMVFGEDAFNEFRNSISKEK
jgi:hypothetical protein